MSENNVNNAPVIPKGRGRPINLNARRYLYIDPSNNFKPVGKGRLKLGKILLRIQVHRKVDTSNFVYGQTQIFDSKEVTIGKAATPNDIPKQDVPSIPHVNIIEVPPPDMVEIPQQ